MGPYYRWIDAETSVQWYEDRISIVALEITEVVPYS